jgi:hypothetical protein
LDIYVLGKKTPLQQWWLYQRNSFKGEFISEAQSLKDSFALDFSNIVYKLNFHKLQFCRRGRADGITNEVYNRYETACVPYSILTTL